MPSFRSLDELNKHLSKTNGSRVNLSNGMSVMKLMKQEGKRLYDIIQKHINTYYASYDPVYYERTYQFMKSLRIEPVKISGIIASVKIYFDEDLATHHSIMGGKDGYLPILLNEGWQWKNGDKSRYHMSFYPGYHFIEKAIKEYNSSNPYGFKIIVHKEWNGNMIEHKEY